VRGRKRGGSGRGGANLLRTLKIDIVLRRCTCYVGIMTKEQITAVLDRVKTWPKSRQEDAARVLLEMEAQDKSRYQLTGEQTAEVRRRRAENNPNRIPFEDVFKRLRTRGR